MSNKSQKLERKKIKKPKWRNKKNNKIGIKYWINL